MQPAQPNVTIRHDATDGKYYADVAVGGGTHSFEVTFGGRNLADLGITDQTQLNEIQDLVKAMVKVMHANHEFEGQGTHSYSMILSGKQAGQITKTDAAGGGDE